MAFRAALAAFLLALSATAQAGLIGQTVFARGSVLWPASAIIGAGPEFQAMSLVFDFTDDTLSVTPDLPPGAIGMGWGAFGIFEFYGFASNLDDIYVDSNVGFSGPALSDFWINQNRLFINFSSGFACCGSGTRLVYRLSTSVPVSAPSSLALSLLGVAMLCGIHVRQRRGSGNAGDA